MVNGRYRPDVDGLRALAVLAVLCFHAFPQALPGGFAGVDIFFVISGFLISGIILGQIRADTFTFADFYRRRIRRIFPALAVVLAASLLFGWCSLIPADFRQLGTHVAAGAGFVSNLQLWSESGYFDTAAESKPLLHLWSLGVEEQYYLVWPLMLVIFRRHVERIFWMILVVAAGSFAVNLFLVAHEPTAAFYLPMGRFWELMLGSIIAYVQIFRAPPVLSVLTRNLLAFAGAALIAAGFAMLNQDRNFPGFWALLPCVGTSLLISSGEGAWLNRKVFSLRPVVFIGLISYPLYLWHWPLLVYARIMLGEPSLLVRVMLLLLSVLLAWATYQFVEKRVRTPAALAARPLRAPRPPDRRPVVSMLAASVAALGVIGLLAGADFLQARSASVPFLAPISAAFTDRTYKGDRIIRGDSPSTVMFFGDSHMQHYLPRIEQLMKEHRAPLRTVEFRTHPGCAPFPELERTARDCAPFVRETFELARQPQVDTVIIAASWVGITERQDYYRAGDDSRKQVVLLAPGTDWVLDGFEQALRDLSSRGKHVVLVLSSPRGESLSPRSMVTRRGFEFTVKVSPPLERAAAVADNAFIDDRIREIAHRVGAELIDPMDSFCSRTQCPAVDSRGNPLYTDETHLRSSTVRDRFKAFDRFVYLESAGH